MQHARETGFSKWKNTIDGANANPAWNGYDTTIQATVATYSKHLPGINLRWKLIKAMVWTESGGPSNAVWNTRPMQIGNPGDPGLTTLFSGKEGGHLILPPDIAATLTEQNARTQPVRNIQAGVGYLLLRAANYVTVNTPDNIDTIHAYVIKQGDSLSSIARKEESTVDELQLLNPSLGVLHKDQVIKVKKSKMAKKIVGFKKLDTSTVARLYNTRDHSYAEKLDYCLAVMK